MRALAQDEDQRCAATRAIAHRHRPGVGFCHQSYQVESQTVSPPIAASLHRHPTKLLEQLRSSLLRHPLSPILDPDLRLSFRQLAGPDLDRLARRAELDGVADQ